MANQKLEVTRTLGFEIECLLDRDLAPTHIDSWGDRCVDYDEVSVAHCEIGDDGSICGDGVGIEAKTRPINDLNIVETVFKELKSEYDFDVNDTCGLHIHVDTSDFTVADRVRLLRFGAGIELLMFSLVDETRYYGRNDNGRNNYCVKLHKGWRKIYRNSYVNQDVHEQECHSLERFTNRVENLNNDEIWNGRYQWLNAQVSHCPTSEFRIFSSTTDYEQAQKFGMLAYHIIETVKNSTVSQIKFIIKSIYQATTTNEMFNKFFDSIGLDNEFRFEPMNDRLVNYLDTKYCARNREQAQGGQQAV